jgi:hypothetical protein
MEGNDECRVLRESATPHAAIPRMSWWLGDKGEIVKKHWTSAAAQVTYRTRRARAPSVGDQRQVGIIRARAV